MSSPSNLSFYERFARLPRPRTFSGKFLLVAFLGTHLPLIAAFLYVLFSVTTFGEAWPFLLVLLLVTLLGAAFTLFGLYQLLRPVPRTAQALRRYAEDGTLPDLPTHHDDDAGRLMRSTQETLTHLDELIRFRDRMFSVLAHDLRSPATSALLAGDVIAEQLRRDPPDPSVIQEMTGLIRSAVHRQLDFTEAILEQISKDTAHLQVHYEPVDAADMLRRVAEPARLMARRKGVDFRLKTASAEGQTFHTDPAKLEEVLQNLVRNAVKFTSRGGRVVLRMKEGTPEQICFAVHDTGAGIDAGTLQTLFEPYQKGRAPDDSDEEAEGFGMGLWIAKTFTNLLGGSLEVDTAPGEGSTFRVCLDRAPASSARNGERERSGGEADQTASSSGDQAS